MPKQDIRPATIEDFAYWINERHHIYLRRKADFTKPWSEDPIFQEWKFTNVYRQLDTGTVWLQKMIEGQTDPKLLAFNIIWYRLFNRFEHARDLGFIKSFEPLRKYITKCWRDSKKVFTLAHMTTGVFAEFKYQSYLRAAKIAWQRKAEIVKACKNNLMQEAFDKCLTLFMVGKFVAYEMVCDFRFSPLLENATDTKTWANMGPGAHRGLLRLRYEPTMESMKKLWVKLNYPIKHLKDHVFECEWPFELREIEHSLCEFDKYQRVKTGVGRPRQKYNGKAD